MAHRRFGYRTSDDMSALDRALCSFLSQKLVPSLVASALALEAPMALGDSGGERSLEDLGRQLLARDLGVFNLQIVEPEAVV
jgi:hypothetical protein